MRIIAVDDDQNMLDLLGVVLLSNSSHTLELSSSPQKALKKINSHIRKYDCILLDISMPGMDGITLCREIRKNARYSHTPIIMLTANADKNCIESAFSAGATDFVRKPFDIHELSARVRVANELSSAHNEIRALRLRAKVNDRNVKADSPDVLDSTAKIPLEYRQLDNTEVCFISGTRYGQVDEDHITQSEVRKLFSNDLSDHVVLHRNRKRMIVG